MDHHTISSGELLVAGDFNIHMDDPSCIKAQAMMDLLHTHNLDQHVHEPTHKHGHTLDLLITRATENITQDIRVFDPDISDHYSVIFSLPMKKSIPGHKEIQFRKLRSIITSP